MFKFFRKKKLEVLPPEVQEKLDAEYERCYCNNWKNIVRMNGGKEFLTKREYNYVMYTVIYYSLHKRYMAECKKVQEKIDAEYNVLYGQKGAIRWFDKEMQQAYREIRDKHMKEYQRNKARKNQKEKEML